MLLIRGPYEWRERFAGSGRMGWKMPAGAVSAWDLRPLSEQGNAGIVRPSPRTLFLLKDGAAVPSGFDAIGDDPAGTLTSARRNLLREAFGVPTSSATRLTDLVWELWTQQGDPTGVRTTYPIRGNRHGLLRLRSGSWCDRHVRAQPGNPEWPLVRAMHRAEYRRLRERAIARDSEVYLKYLGALRDKYGLDDDTAVAEFIAPDLPRERPKNPTTTITETFPGSSATLGGDQTWTDNVLGSWENVSGEAKPTTGVFADNQARCESVLSSDDMYAQVIVVTHESGNNYKGPVARFDDDSEDCYRISANQAINDYYGNKVLSTVSSDILVSELTGSITLPTTDKIVVDGSDVEIFQGLTNSRGSTTDTGIAGFVRAGLYAAYQNSTNEVFMNDFEAADLAAAPLEAEVTDGLVFGEDIDLSWIDDSGVDGIVFGDGGDSEFGPAGGGLAYAIMRLRRRRRA